MNSMRSKIIATALLAAATAGPLSAQLPEGIIPTPDEPPTRQGTRGANFLQIGVGARAAAMAGALTSLVEGPTAWYWNPAGAAATEQFSFSAARQELYTGLDITHSFFGVSLPFLGGVIGANFVGLNSGELLRTTEDNPAGGDPILGSTFEWRSTSVGVGYARRLTDRLDLGLAVKRVDEGIDDAKVNWMAIDVGTQFRTGLYGLTLGASLQNVGPSARARGSLIQRKINSDDFALERTDVEFGTKETELPTLFRFSVGSDLYGGSGALLGQTDTRNSLLAELAFSDAIDTDIQLGFGLEYGFNNMFFLRGGKRFYNDDREFGSSKMKYGLSAGAGLRIPISSRSFRLDYAYTSLGELDNVQVFSFEFGR
ncbi:MAG: PorV/PorQ family protein [Gemmatimonadaceae bacterium]